MPMSDKHHVHAGGHARQFGRKKEKRLMKLSTRRKIEREADRRHLRETMNEVEHLLRNVKLGDE